MADWWNALDLLRQVLYIIAIPSTVILLLQTILLLFGMGQDGDADTGFDSEADADVDPDAADGGFVSEGESYNGPGPEHSAGLRVLSVRGIIAFLTVCGWVGLALLDLGVVPVLACLLASLAGIGAMVLVALVFRSAMKLQQSGNLDFRNAVGLTGEVYVTIHEGKKGKVNIVVQERFMEMDAICHEGELKAGTQVRVSDVTESNLLIVEKIN